MGGSADKRGRPNPGPELRTRTSFDKAGSYIPSSERKLTEVAEGFLIPLRDCSGLECARLSMELHPSLVRVKSSNSLEKSV
jgi:hypothetical protein